MYLFTLQCKIYIIIFLIGFRCVGNQISHESSRKVLFLTCLLLASDALMMLLRMTSVGALRCCLSAEEPMKGKHAFQKFRAATMARLRFPASPAYLRKWKNIIKPQACCSRL